MLDSTDVKRWLLLVGLVGLVGCGDNEPSVPTPSELAHGVVAIAGDDDGLFYTSVAAGMDVLSRREWTSGRTFALESFGLPIESGQMWLAVAGGTVVWGRREAFATSARYRVRSTNDADVSRIIPVPDLRPLYITPGTTARLSYYDLVSPDLPLRELDLATFVVEGDCPTRGDPIVGVTVDSGTAWVTAESPAGRYLATFEARRPRSFLPVQALAGPAVIAGDERFVLATDLDGEVFIQRGEELWPLGTRKISNGVWFENALWVSDLEAQELVRVRLDGTTERFATSRPYATLDVIAGRLIVGVDEPDHRRTVYEQPLP